MGKVAAAGNTDEAAKNMVTKHPMVTKPWLKTDIGRQQTEQLAGASDLQAAAVQVASSGKRVNCGPLSGWIVQRSSGGKMLAAVTAAGILLMAGAEAEAAVTGSSGGVRD